MLFGVTGHPVLHSRSTALHRAGLPGARSIRIAASTAEYAVQTAKEIGLSLLNVTAPFKADMLALCGSSDTDALRTGAVNTVIFCNGQVQTFNTDVYGVRTAIETAGVRPRRVVLLGAGGAGRACYHALCDLGVELSVANRTLERAQTLVAERGGNALSLADPELFTTIQRADLIVSALSSGWSELDLSCLHAGQSVLEAVYGVKTELIERARAVGANIIEPTRWLLHQGERSLELCTGHRPDRNAMALAIEQAQPKRPKHVALIGIMGTGKSFIGSLLAEAMGLQMCEVDKLIEVRAGKTIKEIFDDEGEPAFRAREQNLIEELLDQTPRIISCGGGAVVQPRNRALLTASCLCVWLWTAPQECARRLAGDTTRPLLQGDQPGQRLAKILLERIPSYVEASDFVVNTSQGSPQEVEELIRYEIDHTIGHIG